MNSDSWTLLNQYLPQTYIKQANDSIKNKENIIRQLLQHKKLPEEGWDDGLIEKLLRELSDMDSNNFLSNCGVGEREGRFASQLVARRHYNFAHGIGRSGDLCEIQPKAAGSSLMAKLTNELLKDVFKIAGLQETVYSILVPVATSMSLVLSFLTLASKRPNAKYIIWSRIDQKACFKSIISAGFKPVIVDTILKNDELNTDVQKINEKILELDKENILCILTTSSCFAPRGCDNLEAIAKLCKEFEIPHVINNAYGLQCKNIMKKIQRAHRVGRVDIFVQSTDKNLMVPVGGTIIASFQKPIIESLSSNYPGRASASPLIDVFITLLSLGKKGYSGLLEEREEIFGYFKQKLIELAKVHDERILETPNNPISIGFTLKTLQDDQLTKLGSMLFLRNVSGARVITTKDTKSISDWNFEGWGSHCHNYPVPYLTCAASIGVTKNDVDLLLKRLDKVLLKLKKNDTT